MFRKIWSSKSRSKLSYSPIQYLSLAQDYKEGGNDIEALRSKSRRPKSNPNEHTKTEIKLIKDMRRRNPNIGLQNFWIKLQKRGYTRTMQRLEKALKRLQILKALDIEVECVQIDNGTEFTKQFMAKETNNHSMFEVTAKRLKVKVKRIKPHTPKHNGKVERSHREDQKLLYSEIIRTGKLITDENDFKRRLKRHQDKTNNRPMRPLNYLTPKQYLEQYKKKLFKE